MMKRLALESVPGGLIGSAILILMPRVIHASERLVQRAIGVLLVIVPAVLVARTIFRFMVARATPLPRRPVSRRCTSPDTRRNSSGPKRLSTHIRGSLQAALFEQLAARTGDPHRRVIRFDEAALVGLFPHRKSRAGRAPRRNHFFIAALVCDKFEEVEDEIFDGCFTHTSVISACAGE